MDLEKHQSYISEENNFSDSPKKKINECSRCSAALTATFLTLFRNLFQLVNNEARISNHTNVLCVGCNNELQRFLNGEEFDVNPEIFREQIKLANQQGYESGRGEKI